MTLGDRTTQHKKDISTNEARGTKKNSQLLTLSHRRVLCLLCI